MLVVIEILRVFIEILRMTWQLIEPLLVETFLSFIERLRTLIIWQLIEPLLIFIEILLIFIET